MHIHSTVGLITNSSSEVFIMNNHHTGSDEAIYAAIQKQWDEIRENDESYQTGYYSVDVRDFLDVEVVINEEQLEKAMESIKWYLQHYMEATGLQALLTPPPRTSQMPKVGTILIWTKCGDNSIPWGLVEWIEHELSPNVFRVHLG
jgi:hypothetical protein